MTVTPAWPSLGVVIPVYNEGATIEHGGRVISEMASRYPGRAVVIAVNDGSEDDSGGILDRLADEIELLDVFHREANGGYGAAQRTGARRALELGLDDVSFIDADLTNPPEDVLRMAELAREGHPYIKASRFVPGGGMINVFVLRRAMTRLASWVCRMLFWTPVRDPTSGFGRREPNSCARGRSRRTGSRASSRSSTGRSGRGSKPVEIPTMIGGRGKDQRNSSFTWSPSLVASYFRYPAGAFRRRAASLVGRGGGSAAPASELLGDRRGAALEDEDRADAHRDEDGERPEQTEGVAGHVEGGGPARIDRPDPHLFEDRGDRVDGQKPCVATGNEPTGYMIGEK